MDSLRRLGRLEKALLATLIPLWVACFALSIKSAIRHIEYPSGFVSAPEDEDGNPTLTGFRAYLSGAESGLQVG